MAGNVLVDTGFVVALLSDRDTHHAWARSEAARFNPPWATCEAVLSETFHLLGSQGGRALGDLLRRQSLRITFDLAKDLSAVLALMRKYSDIPMDLADACLVRMSETLPDPIILTTDADFRLYRRHGRQVVPSAMPH
jgi:predicted nucleic acid-binding protein